MTLTYRLIKGSPLTATEVDDNIRTLDERIRDLEDSQETQFPLGSIHREGPDITFQNTAGDIMGRISLPLPKMTPTGNWAPKTPYDFWDLCHYDGKIHICHTPHISLDMFGGMANWAVFLDSQLLK